MRRGDKRYGLDREERHPFRLFPMFPRARAMAAVAIAIGNRPNFVGLLDPSEHDKQPHLPEKFKKIFVRKYIDTIWSAVDYAAKSCSHATILVLTPT
jgi:hypothetical protein